VKANQSTTYAKSEVDDALGLKANQQTTYSKDQIDAAMSGKQPLITPLPPTFWNLNQP
jgi:hypothetical protein